MRVWLTWLAVAVLAGCSATRHITSDPDDYARYRRTRTAKTSEARLAAGHDYLKKSPDGRWSTEVRAWFERAEPKFYERSASSKAGLLNYLATLPDGPHAVRARERISELEGEKRIEARRDAEVLEEAMGVEQKLEDADLMRRSVVREVSDWAGRLAAIRTFGAPTSELHHETIHRLRVEAPVARCLDERCRKSVTLPFAIPDGRRLAPRKALFDVELELYRGAVVRARLAGPELWNRLYEASERRPVRAGDAQARTESIARAVQIVEAALGSDFADDKCRRDPVSPVVLERECNGVRVRALAAATPEEDDELVVEPLPRKSP